MKQKIDKIIQFLCVVFLSMWFSVVISVYIPVFPNIAVVLGLVFLVIWSLDAIYHVLRLRRFINRISQRIEYLYLVVALMFLGVALLLQIQPVKATIQALTPTLQQLPIEYVTIGLFPALTLISTTFLVLMITVVLRSYYRQKYREIKK